MPSLVLEPPASDNWCHEIKHDGFRTMLVVAGGKARAFSRNGFDWSDRCRPIVEAAGKLRCRSAVVDGEVIVQDGDGRSDFAAIRFAMANAQHRLVFYAFDQIGRASCRERVKVVVGAGTIKKKDCE